ncbi:MAG: 50S ribosomal protein L31 [uncultured bacterium]|nr:MAG: 50S ribosomal protein L31 [uncultured bacterium]
MKKDDTHPQYHDDAKVTCSCGHVFTIGSTKKELETDLCSKCHPFYTGQQKLVDTAGRVDKFRQKAEAAKKKQEANAKKAPKKRKRTMEEKVNEELAKQFEKAA